MLIEVLREAIKGQKTDGTIEDKKIEVTSVLN